MSSPTSYCCRARVALHPEGVDRNVADGHKGAVWHRSPSTRRAWIEMLLKGIWDGVYQSPSTRRAWIEMHGMVYEGLYAYRVALHPEGVDRNMSERSPCYKVISVALHPEGVDRNKRRAGRQKEHGPSPSTRRAWIEIKGGQGGKKSMDRRPPPGGRG